MRSTLSIIFYTLILIFLGTLAIAFAAHLIDLNDVIPELIRVYNDVRMRVIMGASGAILILLGFAAAQALSGKIQREKTIAFSNPNGQVTVTLSAVEDLIRRLTQQLSEIKDAKADVRAGKKGIDIRMRVVLRAETNIPEFTARLQDLITAKIQDVFGIDEPINARIHVAKIVAEEKQRKKPDKQHEEITVPYQGIKL